MDDSAKLPVDALRSLVDMMSEPAALVAAEDWRILYANPPFARRMSASGDVANTTLLFAAALELDSTTVRMQLAELVEGKRMVARIETGASTHLAGAITAIRARRIDTSSGLVLAVVLESSASPQQDAAGRHSFDPLTGLSDRGFILEKLRTLLQSDQPVDGKCVVLFVDVDGFKQINDSFGHLVGDRVLCEVARRLASSVRARDHIARFGGDEFLVLLERVSDPSMIEPVVRRIQAAFDQPIALPHGEVTLGVSVGAAQADASGGSAEALIDAADRAMYTAKRVTA